MDETMLEAMIEEEMMKVTFAQDDEETTPDDAGVDMGELIVEDVEEKMLEDEMEREMMKCFAEEDEETTPDDAMEEDMNGLFGDEDEEDLPSTPVNTPEASATPEPKQSHEAAPKALDTAEPKQSHATVSKGGLALPAKVLDTQKPERSDATAPRPGLALPSCPKTPITPDPPQSCATPIEQPSSNNSFPFGTLKPALRFGGRKRKRAQKESNPEPPGKKPRKIGPPNQLRCRYGCDRSITTKAALKAHSEKVHNLFYSGQARAKCPLCDKMFRDPKEKEKHLDTKIGGCRWAFNKPDDWKVPPPRTLQECADTWGMTDIHGEISSYLKVTVNDLADKKLDPLPVEQQIGFCKAANLQEVPKTMEYEPGQLSPARTDTPILQDQVPAQPSRQENIVIDDDQNGQIPTTPNRLSIEVTDDIFDRFQNALTVVENAMKDNPNVPLNVPDWLWQLAGLGPILGPVDTGPPVQNAPTVAETASKDNRCMALRLPPWLQQAAKLGPKIPKPAKRVRLGCTVQNPIELD